MTKAIEKAVAYGIGYVCGKHNLEISKKEVRNVSKKYSKKLKLKK